ncbi:sensor histidine kinase [Spirosoma spitsbergense]|uniref:sensor histidine kinase n=1 Tax=Spirosoma spitsbergense TaxID=431554 RepID=UPI00036BD026|nr:histidine kinase [Spirosoma spitsbergense]
MHASPVPYLTPRQKARIALSILLIYWPIRVYMNVGVLSWNVLWDNAFFFVIELTLTFLFFWGWVSLIDWLQERLLRRFGADPSHALRWPVQLISLAVATGLALIFNAGFAVVHHRMDTGIERQFPRLGRPLETVPRGGRENRQRMNNGLVFMAMLSAFYLTVNRRSTQHIQTLQLQTERLQKEAVQAQFDALKNQVSPHFLFNSLSILSSLVEIDTKLSVQFINRLSKAYRYILDQRDNEQVSLKTELDFIESYTFLLNIRFDDRLKVVINVPEAARIHYQIAPLTLQLLVENAVKHNQMSDEDPLTVTIALVGETLRVSNPIQLRPSSGDSTGMGLQNISSRYRLLTEQPVRVGEHNGDFVVIIPLLMSELRMSE